MSNKWDSLLSYLDQVFGGSDVQSSRYRVLRQGYDNDKHEFFVQLEYRYTRDSSPQSRSLRRTKHQTKQKLPRAKMPVHRARKERNRKNLALMQAVNALARQQSQLKMGGFPLT